MSAPVACTFSLTYLLKIRPDLWESVAKCVMDQGLGNKKHKLEEVLKPEIVVSKPSTKIRVQINKAGGKAEDDEGNTTLSREINNVKSIAIPNSGAGVGIASKVVWVLWENQLFDE